MANIIETSGLVKTYRHNKINIEAIKGVDLNIAKGSINVIIGRSGSGKSTLLKILGGLLKPDDGQVRIDNETVYALSESKRAKFRSSKVGFVFQEFNLINELSVIHNIRLPYEINKMPYDDNLENIIIPLLDLQDRLNFYPDQLSGGERQRTAIARALLMKPSIILADEPTGNLDSDSAQKVMDFVKCSNRQFDQTYVIVTHDAEWLKIATHVFRMSDGSLYAQPI